MIYAKEGGFLGFSIGLHQVSVGGWVIRFLHLAADPYNDRDISDS